MKGKPHSHPNRSCKGGLCAGSSVSLNAWVLMAALQVASGVATHLTPPVRDGVGRILGCMVSHRLHTIALFIPVTMNNWVSGAPMRLNKALSHCCPLTTCYKSRSYLEQLLNIVWHSSYLICKRKTGWCLSLQWEKYLGERFPSAGQSITNSAHSGTFKLKWGLGCYLGAKAFA